MTIATLFVLLLVLVAGVVTACVYVLLSACDEITCSFGPLDSSSDGRREARRRVNRSIDGQRHSVLLAPITEKQIHEHSSPKSQKSSGERYVQRRLSRAY
jgi:hypothetical protein